MKGVMCRMKNKIKVILKYIKSHVLTSLDIIFLSKPFFTPITTTINTLFRTISNRWNIVKPISILYLIYLISSVFLFSILVGLILHIILLLLHLNINFSQLFIPSLLISFFINYSDYIYSRFFKIRFNLKTLYLYPTNRMAINLSLKILLEKNSYTNIKLPKKFIYIEPHTEKKEIKKIKKEDFTINFDNDIARIINNFPNTNIVFFAHTPLPIKNRIIRYQKKSKINLTNIEIYGPYLTKTPSSHSLIIQNKESFWYVYLIIKNKKQARLNACFRK